MKDVSGVPHRVKGVAFVKATIIRDPRSLDISSADAAVSADMAYVREDGLTCGKLSVHTPLCSEETLALLTQFIDGLEKDAALTVFSLDETDVDEPDVEPL